MGTQGHIETSGNFQFLEEHDAVFLQLASTADLITSENSAAALLKRNKTSGTLVLLSLDPLGFFDAGKMSHFATP